MSCFFILSISVFYVAKYNTKFNLIFQVQQNVHPNNQLRSAPGTSSERDLCGGNVACASNAEVEVQSNLEPKKESVLL